MERSNHQEIQEIKQTLGNSWKEVNIRIFISNACKSTAFAYVRLFLLQKILLALFIINVNAHDIKEGHKIKSRKMQKVPWSSTKQNKLIITVLTIHWGNSSESELNGCGDKGKLNGIFWNLNVLSRIQEYTIPPTSILHFFL